MNIILPYSWIKDFLKTKVKPEEVFRLTTASGPTIESFEKKGDDYLLNIEVTINRPDCLSVLGIAREMYAILKQNNLPAKLENDFLSEPIKVKLSKKPLPLKFEIDPRLCPRFNAVLLKEIKIDQSPLFIKERLEKSGVRSINNVIDITNYVMLELGQPNHAFDFDKIKGPTLVIRKAKKQEKVITLDEIERELEQGDIVYEDGTKKLIDLAGIMGGKASEVDRNTGSLLYTVVNDYFAQIRKTSMRLGLQTEASARLSKVLDQEMTYPTMLRAIELFVKYAQAKVESEIYDFYPQPQKRKKIKTADSFFEEKIGQKVESKTIDNILTNLGFSFLRKGYCLDVLPPLWRINDITEPIDLVEEVARLINYDSVPNQPLCFPLPEKEVKYTHRFSTEDKIRQLLVAWGYTETISFSMLSAQDLHQAKIPAKQAIKIANPLTEEWVYLQPSLGVNLIKNIVKNQGLYQALSFFEIANVFDSQGKEERRLIFGSNSFDFFRIKGIVEQLLTALFLNQPAFIAIKEPKFLNKERSAEIIVNEKQIGIIGEIDKEISQAFGLKSAVCLAEINLSSLFTLSGSIKIQPQAKYPAIIEDLSFVIPEKTFVEEILKTIYQTSPLVKKVEIIDSFKQTRTFRIFFQDPKKNLSDQDVAKIREKILKALEEDLKVSLRQ